MVSRLKSMASSARELMVPVEKISRTSDKNRAKKPESIVGRKAIVVGFWRRKEAYAGIKVGDTIECALQHITPRSDHLNVGEFRTSKKSKENERERD